MNKPESVLYLTSPKILSDIFIDSHISETKVDVNDIIGTSSYSIKGEKKYKTVDFIEHKKNKSKHKQKVRNKNYIDKHISDVKEDLEITDMTSTSFNRNIKTTKNKKNYKDKFSLRNNILINNKVNSNDIYLNDLVSVQDLAMKLNVTSTDIIKWLFLQGISVTINQLLDVSIATLVAEYYSFNVIKQNFYSNSSFHKSAKNQGDNLRAPVITFLGHVDHGKTTLLNAIRKDNLFVQEAGNITQAIGSYEVLLDNEFDISKMIFLDTPGHEAFVSMRRRGAEITDLVILVVAADDGLKPQTVEAINYIQSRKLPIVVAVNKIDKPDANINKVKEELLEYNISNCDSNGNNIIIAVSALNGNNIDLLLSSIINVSKSLHLTSDTSVYAEGTILEAYLNKKKGSVAQLLIQNGTLKIGDIVVAGNIYGKVKAIYNSMKEKVQFIESTSLADVLCFTEIPVAGLSFQVVENEKTAKLSVSRYVDLNIQSTLLNNRISLDDVNPKGVKSIIKQVNLIIKTNQQGSIDAIMHTLSSLPQHKVQINLLLVACGEVSLKDIELASTSNSTILVFNLNITSSIIQYAAKRSVMIQRFNVIYDLFDYVKRHMLAFVDVDYEKQVLGYAEVKDLFIVNKNVVAGCFVQSGKLKRNAYFQIKRSNKNIYTGLIHSLKRVKEDVDEVESGNECGVMCKEYNLWEALDILECYELKALEKTL